MVTSKEITEQFKNDLNDLLKKYDAEINLEEEESRSYSRGEDRMIVYIPSKWEGGEEISSSASIDLGRYISVNNI